MLINIGITIIDWLLSLVNLLPNWSIPADALETVESLLAGSTVIDGLFPVYTVYQIVALTLIVEISYWAMRIAISFINWIRGAGEISI